MNIRSVDPDKIIKAITAISFGFDSFDSLCEFIFDSKISNISGGNKNHCSRALSTAIQLNMIKLSNKTIKDSKYKLTIKTKYDPRIWEEKEHRLLFREHIQKFRPFLMYFDFISKGFNHSSAAAKTSSFFNLDPFITGENNILRTWGMYSEIFDKKGNIVEEVLKQSATKNSKYFAEAINNLNNDLTRRNFISKWLGEDAFAFIDEDIINDLTSGLKFYLHDPDKSIRDTGKSLEDFLKLIAKEKNILLVNSKNKPIKTIGTIIQKLREGKVLADHHTSVLQGLEIYLDSNLLQGLNAFRTMPSHGKNFEDNARWELSSELALLYVLQVILAIKSIYHYAIYKKLKY